jgi:hypothetical protein
MTLAIQFDSGSAQVVAGQGGKKLVRQARATQMPGMRATPIIAAK